MNNHRPENKYVVSSLVVHTRQDGTADVARAISALEGATVAEEYHHTFAVVLETTSTESAADLTERIRSIDGVTGVELVAHFFEEEVLDEDTESD
jgi:nitrate reductase NapAB chaperone NapD